MKFYLDYTLKPIFYLYVQDFFKSNFTYYF